MRSLLVALACLFAVCHAGDVVGDLVGQACTTSTGAATTCSAGDRQGDNREACNKVPAVDGCVGVGFDLTVGTGSSAVTYDVCLTDYDCPWSRPRCAPLAALEGTTVCQACRNDTDCDNSAATDVDTVSVRRVCQRFPTSSASALGSCVSPGSTHTVALPNNNFFTYTMCRSDSDCNGELFQSCQTVNGDFRLGTDERTTVCGCNDNAGCNKNNAEFKTCDLTGVMTIVTGTTAAPVNTNIRAVGFCKDPRSLTQDSSTTVARRLCAENSDCSPFLPRCAAYTTAYPTGVTGAVSTNTWTCQACASDADCAWYPGTVCHLTAVTIRGVNYPAGSCAIPVCNSNHECYTTETPVCSNPGNSTGRCVGCSKADDCALFPATPWCTSDDAAAPGVCAEGCYTDGNCAAGFRCHENECVECITAYDCYNRNHTRPICSADHECVFCTEDEQCLNGLPLYEACHTEFEDDVQVKGECVQDTYQKGFQIAALILGTIGVFFVIIALVVAVLAFTKGGD